MKSIDLNADLGEADNAEWARNEAKMLLYISSANIACGGHAGTETSMRHMVRGAKENGVMIGAHPSYPCLLYTSPSPRDQRGSRMPSSA